MPVSRAQTLSSTDLGELQTAPQGSDRVYARNSEVLRRKTRQQHKVSRRGRFAPIEIGSGDFNDE